MIGYRRGYVEEEYYRVMCLEYNGNTSDVDSATAKETLILLEKINAEFGTTILMVTHNQSIPKMMKKNFVMKDGVIIEQYTNETPTPAHQLEL